MKRYQRGEAMLAVMVVMLVVVWLGRGSFGMMGMGHGPDAHKAGQAEQAPRAEPPPASAPKKAAEHEH